MLDLHRGADLMRLLGDPTRVRLLHLLGEEVAVIFQAPGRLVLLPVSGQGTQG